MTSTRTSSTTKKILEFADWNPKAHKFMAPKINNMGGKSVTLISTQSSKSLHVNTPLLMTWGIADFAGDDGISDGKFKLSLNFPNPEYKTKDTDEFLQKMIDFQAEIIDNAVTNSELWFGKKKSKELVEDSFFPFLKYPKFKDANGKSTGAIDYSRPPNISAKVPRYEQPDGTSKWECDLFDTNYNQIFPTEDTDITPVDLVPKLSKIACTLQCSGIWVGGKGWGLTWKFISGVVKPKMQETVRGICHVKLSDNDIEDMNKSVPETEDEPARSVSAPIVRQVIETNVEDSDDEALETAPAAPEPVPAPAATPPVAEPKTVVKKVIKKKVAV